MRYRSLIRNLCTHSDFLIHRNVKTTAGRSTKNSATTQKADVKGSNDGNHDQGDDSISKYAL